MKIIVASNASAIIVNGMPKFIGAEGVVAGEPGTMSMVPLGVPYPETFEVMATMMRKACDHDTPVLLVNPEAGTMGFMISETPEPDVQGFFAEQSQQAEGGGS